MCSQRRSALRTDGCRPPRGGSTTATTADDEDDEDDDDAAAALEEEVGTAESDDEDDADDCDEGEEEATLRDCKNVGSVSSALPTKYSTFVSPFAAALARAFTTAASHISKPTTRDGRPDGEADDDDDDSEKKEEDDVVDSDDTASDLASSAA